MAIGVALSVSFVAFVKALLWWRHGGHRASLEVENGAANGLLEANITSILIDPIGQR